MLGSCSKKAKHYIASPVKMIYNHDYWRNKYKNQPNKPNKQQQKNKHHTEPNET